MSFLQKVYDVISECLFKHPQQLRWVLRTHLCNFVVDKAYRHEADAGFIIQKYLDEEGSKMLEDLEHNPDDEIEDSNEEGFDQYKESSPAKEPAGEYRGFLPQSVKDEQNETEIKV